MALLRHWTCAGFPIFLWEINKPSYVYLSISQVFYYLQWNINLNDTKRHTLLYVKMLINATPVKYRAPWESKLRHLTRSRGE